MHRFSVLLIAFLGWAVILFAQGGPPGAAITDLAGVWDDPNTMFAATERGVFHSKTAGHIWTPMNDGLPILNIPSIAGNRGLLLAAVREHGVYRISEGGTWEAANTGMEGEDVLTVAMDPDNSDIAYAGTAGGHIFKTLNGGDAWTSVSSGLSEGSYIEIAISPTDSDLILVTNLNPQDATGRILRSTNGGTSWNVVVTGPIAFLKIDFSRSNPGTAWVATETGIARSTDGGATFSAPILRDWVFYDLAIDPDDSQIIYAATRANGIFRTENGGQDWFLATEGLAFGAVNRLEITRQAIYAGLDGSGVFRSSDSGFSWRMSSAGMHAASALALAVNPGNGERVLAATTGGGMFRSSSGGTAWGDSRTGLNTFQVNSLRHDPQSPDTVYAGSINPFNAADGRFLRSSDAGAAWELLWTGAPVYAIATHPADGATVYIGTLTNRFFGTSGLWRSRDRGATFDPVPGQGRLEFLDVIETAIDPSNPRNLYVIARDQFTVPTGYEFLRSNDEGGSFIGSGLSSNPLTGITIDPANPSRILVGSLAGVFLSVNGGQDFAAVNTGLPDDGAVAVISIVIDGNDGGATYAATTSGVFKSVDGAASWSSANSGLEAALVRKLRVDPNNAGVLYAATSDAGVYKTIDGGANWTPTGGVPALSAAGVVNGASFKNSAVSPGEIVSVFVQNAGPAEGVLAGLDPATGKLPTALAGVRVFFDDTAAPLFFVRFDQLNVQVPFEVAGLETVDVRVEYLGSASSAASVAVQATHPGVFSPVLNQDDSLNSESNPARPGSAVQLYATGQGAVTPPVMTGQPAPSVAPLAIADAEVEALVNGTPAIVEFKGLSPGFVGLQQVNVRLPVNASGRIEIRIVAGGVESTTKAVVFVR